MQTNYHLLRFRWFCFRWKNFKVLQIYNCCTWWTAFKQLHINVEINNKPNAILFKTFFGLQINMSFYIAYLVFWDRVYIRCCFSKSCGKKTRIPATMLFSFSTLSGTLSRIWARLWVGSGLPWLHYTPIYNQGQYD